MVATLKATTTLQAPLFQILTYVAPKFHDKLHGMLIESMSPSLLIETVTY